MCGALPGFVLSEEDKSCRAAVEYWFRTVDLDGDGYISGYEVRPSVRVRSMLQAPRRAV